MAWLRRICFILLGIVGFADATDPFEIGRLTAGIIVGILFGFVASVFFKMVLWLMNPKLNKTTGKKAIKEVVDRGMMFLLPFTVMSILAVFVLGWQANSVFVGPALMCVGVVVSSELEKAWGKAKFKNTITTVALSGGFASLWILAVNKAKFLPSYIAGGYDLIRSLIENRM